MTEDKSVFKDRLPSVAVEGLEAFGAQGRVIQSEAIFCGQTSALIAHGQELYTLRITRQGKLVLNK